MKNKSINVKLQTIINIGAAIILIPLILTLFIESPYIPTIDEIFGKSGVYDNESECVTFLNVGEGDAILIRSNGRFVLIDTGDGESTNIIRSLKQNGVKGLDALILTHWHNDHIGAAQEIMKEFPVMNLVSPRIPNSNEEAFDDAMAVNDAAEQCGVRFNTAVQGLAVNVGDFRLTVIYCNPENKDENNRSAVIMAKCRKYKFLFMADAEASLEEEILDYGINLDCDVIKIAHHGSKNSNSKEFIEACTPSHAVISVGLKNQYGHPSDKVLDMLNSKKIAVYRTDLSGEIDVNILEEQLEFSCALAS